jgi:hypothetical protein
VPDSGSTRRQSRAAWPANASTSRKLIVCAQLASQKKPVQMSSAALQQGLWRAERRPPRAREREASSRAAARRGVTETLTGHSREFSRTDRWSHASRSLISGGLHAENPRGRRSNTWNPVGFHVLWNPVCWNPVCYGIRSDSNRRPPKADNRNASCEKHAAPRHAEYVAYMLLSALLASARAMLCRCPEALGQACSSAAGLQRRPAISNTAPTLRCRD